MRDAKANKNLEKLINIVDSEGIQADKLSNPFKKSARLPKMKKIRW